MTPPASGPVFRFLLSLVLRFFFIVIIIRFNLIELKRLPTPDCYSKSPLPKLVFSFSIRNHFLSNYFPSTSTQSPCGFWMRMRAEREQSPRSPFLWLFHFFGNNLLGVVNIRFCVSGTKHPYFCSLVWRKSYFFMIRHVRKMHMKMVTKARWEFFFFLLVFLLFDVFFLSRASWSQPIERVEALW